MQDQTNLKSSPWVPVVATALLGAAVGTAYGGWRSGHGRRLHHALPGGIIKLATPGGGVSLYGEGNGEGTPLLFVHGINAAASSYEMRPLFLHYAGLRPTYAIDLPGYGLSERKRQTYTPRIMADAVTAAVQHIRQRHKGMKVDLMALSVSCEYAARVALERPDDIRSLGLISPTGFDRVLSGRGRAQSTKGSGLKLTIVGCPVWSQALYDLVVSRASMRFFLRKTFGSEKIDEGLFEYDQVTAHQPGAMHVVWSFLSGFLFADDVTRIYKTLRLPVWTVHGRRGDFVDFSKEHEVEGRTNWTFDEFDTGAMPQFEQLDAMIHSYEAFSGRLPRLT